MVIVLVILLGTLYGLSFILPVDASSKIHGSATFGKKNINSSKKGLVIDGQNAISEQDSFTHAMIISPTGTGKTQKYILPNILLRDDASMIITDPKGELFDLCAQALIEKSYDIKVLDVKNIHSSFRYNPLDVCINENETKAFAKNLISVSKGSFQKDDPFWSIGGENILFIFLTCLRQLPYKYRTIGTLITLLNHLEDGTLKCEYFIKKYAPHEEVYQKFKAFVSQEQKIRLGQLATAQSALSLWDTKEIKTLTSKSTIDFDDLRSKKTAVFLKLPIGSSVSLGAFLSVYFSQMLTHLMNTELNDGDLPIYILAEEFGAIKRIGKITESIALLRSKQVSISIIVQNLGLIDKLYSKEVRETLLSNCSSIIVYPGQREQATLQFMEQMMGERTVETFIPGSYGVRLDKRALMTRSEVRTMKHSLFLYGNEQPMKIYPKALWKNKRLLQISGLHSVNGKLRPLKAPETSLLPMPTIDDLYQYHSIDEIIDPEVYNRKKQLSSILHEKDKDKQHAIIKKTG